MPELLVLGGDSFGEYHARQLRRAAAGNVRVVTSDWLEELGEWIPNASPDDQLVPGPMMPHLLWQWLAGELGAEAAPPPRAWGLPFEKPGPAGELYLSAAAWVCPATCIEPAHCPVLHAPRDWDLGDIIESRALAEGLRPAVFRCVHYAGGVGTVAASALQAAAAAPSGPNGILVATTSRCHAAVGCLSLEPVR